MLALFCFPANFSFRQSTSGFVSIIFLFTSLILCFAGCHTDDDTKPPKGIQISNVSIPSSINVTAQGTITLSGKGFEEGEKIKLISTSGENQTYLIELSAVNDESVSFVLPAGVLSGTYKIIVVRGNEELLLGSTNIRITVAIPVPDVAGMTVKGIVYSNGVGIPGVVVSDGYNVTVTDRNGIYYLTSEKKNGYVFISVPANYEVAYDNNIPQFFQRLTAGSSIEQKDFSLVPVSNGKYVMLATSDWHLANRNDDIQQFSSGFLKDANALIADYTNTGTRVYGLALGDLSWDLYWYENHFALPEYLTQMKNVNCPIFSTMGNHDNDPYITDDWTAAAKFRDVVGPNYYSFNIGEVHYIVLDDIQYLNTGGSQGVIGQRNYNDVVVNDQMQWLQKDLATIHDKTAPLIISMHAPLYGSPAVDGNGNEVNTIKLNNGSSFLTALNGFADVHLLTGHIHVNYTVRHSASIIEHNTAAVCATWWWTGKNGYAGNHICKDGSPGGYNVFEINGRDLKWYYKSIGYPKSYQFRAYDLNRIQITSARFAPNSTDDALAPYAGAYANASPGNEVLINVFGYGPGWKVEVSEGGTPLTVTRVSALDPLHIISYEAKRLNAGATPTEEFVTSQNTHMFKVKASGGSSTLDIKVTDNFGNVYSEAMQRPKEFTYQIK